MTKFILLLFISGHLASQTQEQKDSLIKEICNTINNSKTDESVLTIFNEKHVDPFLKNYPVNMRHDIRTSIHFRAMHNCESYKLCIDKYYPQKGDWVVLQRKPPITTDTKECKKITEHQRLYYKERSGDTVFIDLRNGFWIDQFKDGTYSKLKLSWTNDCEFEIEFIESNNITRKNFSKPGDKYNYTIISKENGYYYMTAQRPEVDKIMGFRIYY